MRYVHNRKNKIKTLKWPNEGPDLNPIEMLWQDQKGQLFNTFSYFISLLHNGFFSFYKWNEPFCVSLCSSYLTTSCMCIWNYLILKLNRLFQLILSQPLIISSIRSDCILYKTFSNLYYFKLLNGGVWELFFFLNNFI